MENLSSHLLVAIVNKDVAKLNQLKHQIKINAFANSYLEPNGINGSIPPEAWINELPKHLAQ